MPRALIGNFKGPKGDKGDTGPQGIQGPQGPQGEQGIIDSSSTVDFTQAYSRVNINSGESCATLFGKIKKYFADLKTVAFTGSYNDLSNKPTLGTAASKGVANNLTAVSSGESVLDALQGKVLNDSKLAKSSVLNNLLTTSSGYALDARQGKVLNDKITEWKSEHIGGTIVVNITPQNTMFGLFKYTEINEMLGLSCTAESLSWYVNLYAQNADVYNNNAKIISTCYNSSSGWYNIYFDQATSGNMRVSYTIDVIRKA